MIAQERSRFPDVPGFVLTQMSRWPRRVLDGFGYVAYFVTYHVLRWRRRLSLTNVANAFPEKSPAEHQAIVQQSYRNLGRFLAESLWGWNASADALAERVRIVNPELITRFTAQGQSVVLLAAHFCNWEWLILTRRHRASDPHRCRVQAAARARHRYVPEVAALALRRQSHPAPELHVRGDEAPQRGARVCARGRPHAQAQRGKALDHVPQPGHGVLRGGRQDRQDPEGAGDLRRDAP